MGNEFFVYILTNTSGCFYVGMTRDPSRRWWQHVHREGARFTREYHVGRLLYCRSFPDRASARAHEHSLKRRSRKRKWAAIQEMNPTGEDLSVMWGWRKPLDSRRE